MVRHRPRINEGHKLFLRKYVFLYIPVYIAWAFLLLDRDLTLSPLRNSQEGTVGVCSLQTRLVN